MIFYVIHDAAGNIRQSGACAAEVLELQVTDDELSIRVVDGPCDPATHRVEGDIVVSR